MITRTKKRTTADIEIHMRDLYDIEISDSTISKITDRILPIVKEWQERPLEEVYAVVFVDAIHYHVRSEGRIVKRAVYIAIGIDMSGRKDVLGMYVGENESAKFWLTIMNSLKSLIHCFNKLTKLAEYLFSVVSCNKHTLIVLNILWTNFKSYRNALHLILCKLPAR